MSFDVPLKAFAVATTLVPNAVLMLASSDIEPPDKPQATVPVFVPVTVQKAWNVTVPSFHDLGKHTVN